jgi:phosphoribosyl 1,2-cyclic phosphodiesterase
MLSNGPYPPVLKQRVGGPFGHLSNQQAAELLARIDTDHLQHLVIAHLSEKNNEPELPRALLSEVLGCRAEEILVADQPDGMSWLSLN